MLNLYSNLHWHVSNKQEEKDLITKMSSVKYLHILANLPKKNTDEKILHKFRNKNDPLRICFLSRIAKMKNLLFIIKVLNNLNISVEFNVYGPIEDKKYWELCRQTASKLPSNIDFSYFGPIKANQVYQEIAKADLFFT